MDKPLLPMIAFRFTGLDGAIELTIEEVFGFPNETSYGGGYGARGTFSVKSGGYAAKDMHYFTTGELFEFYTQLKVCYENMRGEAELTNTERKLELKCSFDKLGHVTFKGNFQSRPAIGNILRFEVASDQTQIRESLGLLEKVYGVFGGMTGVKRVL
jgi:hypothetical protein